jgi:hypothetical protein
VKCYRAVWLSALRCIDARQADLMLVVTGMRDGKSVAISDLDDAAGWGIRNSRSGKDQPSRTLINGILLLKACSVSRSPAWHCARHSPSSSYSSARDLTGHERKHHGGRPLWFAWLDSDIRRAIKAAQARLTQAGE